jgi:hypothetical protein
MNALLLTAGLLLIALAMLVELLARSGKSTGRSSPDPRDRNFDLSQYEQKTFPLQRYAFKARLFLLAYVYSFRVFVISVFHSLKNKAQIPIMAIRQVIASIQFGRGILQS